MALMVEIRARVMQTSAPPSELRRPVNQMIIKHSFKLLLFSCFYQLSFVLDLKKHQSRKAWQ